MLFFSMATCFSVAIEKPLLLSWIFILTDFPHYQAIILNYLYLQFFLIIFLTINPNPACQLSLWEETGEPGENPRLSAVLTNSSHVRSDVRYRARTHDLSCGRRSLRRLSHRSPNTHLQRLTQKLLWKTDVVKTHLTRQTSGVSGTYALFHLRAIRERQNWTVKGRFAISSEIRCQEFQRVHLDENFHKISAT